MQVKFSAEGLEIPPGSPIPVLAVQSIPAGRFLTACRIWSCSLRMLAVLSGIFLACVAAASSAVETNIFPEEPEGYRLRDYLSPTPLTLQGTRVVDAQQLNDILQSHDGVVLVDVLPYLQKPKDFPKDRIWRSPKRYHIEATVWMPNIGYGEISQETEDYFRKTVEKLLENANSGQINNKGKVVFYCLKDCWHSWNAAKRAVSFDIADVYWFPGGTTEWDALGYDTVRGKPEKFPHENLSLTPDG